MSEQQNPFDVLNSTIQSDPTAVDSNVPAFGGAAITAGNDAVVEVTASQIKEKLSSIDEAKTLRLAEWSNEAELVALTAKAPNTAKYVTEVMGITKAEVKKGPEEYIGKELPIKVPVNATQTFDGYQIKTPDGQLVTIHKDLAIDWLMENTLGYIVGGNNGFELAIVENNSGKAKNPYKVSRVGISNSNPDHMVDTFQPATVDGVPETTSRTVNLDPGADVRDAQQKIIQLRGKIEGFPVFERKPEFQDSLGSIAKKTRGRITGTRDRQAALHKYAEMLVRMEMQNA